MHKQDRTNTEFLKPPVLLNAELKERKTGIEFEFSGVQMHETARIITRIFDGSITETDSYRIRIEDTTLGTFRLELDASLFLNRKYEKVLRSIGVDLNTLKNKESLEDKIRDVASAVVPFEVISPPVPISRLNELEQLVNALRNERAKGTKSNILYAFGLHLNPEVPALSPSVILRYIRAFILLEPWIRKTGNIDLSRRVSPFIKEYTEEFRKKLMDLSYSPSVRELISDYTDLGNDRNRSLDLLPLFEFMDKETLRDKIDDSLTSARPTFHYRLPDCDIDNTDWHLAQEWNRWVWVERMAESEQLNSYCRQYYKMMIRGITKSTDKWIQLMRRWMENGED